MLKTSSVLVVEDSRFFRNLVRDTVKKRIDADVVAVETLAETKEAVQKQINGFDFALVDIVLPDAPNGEAVDWLLEQGLACVVFTGMFSASLRERLLAQNVVDYVVKDTPSSLEYLMDLVEQLHRNYERKVLVVDDSDLTRRYIIDQLRTYNLRPIGAKDGQEGLQALYDNPDVQLVISDFHMPMMDGVEMVRRMRMTHGRDRLAIIGVSSGGGGALSANFIKHGANDYLNKPFLREEFFCRVTQNLRMLDMIAHSRDMSIRDALTGIHNRRYLFDVGANLFASASRDQVALTVAMVDVDFFKKINETYGHDCGDLVLQKVASTLVESCRQTDVVARFGAEEFAILAIDMQNHSVEILFNALREKLEKAVVMYGDKRIQLTASIGVCHGVRDSLEEMLKISDDMLSKAKADGRNCVRVI